MGLFSTPPENIRKKVPRSQLGEFDKLHNIVLSHPTLVGIPKPKREMVAGIALSIWACNSVIARTFHLPEKEIRYLQNLGNHCLRMLGAQGSFVEPILDQLIRDGHIPSQNASIDAEEASSGDRPSQTSIAEDYRLMLKRQSERLPEHPTPVQERTIRLISMTEVTLKLMDAHPISAAIVEDPQDCQQLKRALMTEYIPLCAIPDPDEIPEIFEQYMLFKAGDGGVEVNIPRLKMGIRNGIDSLDAERKKDMLESKHRFEWGKLV